MTIRLSICIATFRRAAFIGETLDALIDQLTPEVEIVVLDGASPDATEQVVRERAAQCPALRYIRAETNSGVDADYDRAVTAALGEHCWLFPDDDVVAPGAVQTVLAELADGDPDALVVDAEVRDLHLANVLEPRRLGFTGRRDYAAADHDALLGDAGNALSFIGCLVIRRSCWMGRNRSAYFGSLFVHVGVMFQQPPLRHVRVLGRSLVRIRMGNAMWGPRAFEIWMFTWPALIWGFAGYGDAAKARVTPREPWRGWRPVLQYRALGSLDRQSHAARIGARASRFDRAAAAAILMLPGRLAHVAMMGLLARTRARRGSVAYNLLVASRHTNRISRWIGRCAGQKLPAPPANRG